MASHRRGRHRRLSPLPVKAVRVIVGAGGLGVLGLLWVTDDAETPLPEFAVTQASNLPTPPPLASPPTMAVSAQPSPEPTARRPETRTSRAAPRTTEDPEPPETTETQEEEEADDQEDEGDRQAVVRAARSFLGLGIPYVWGGKSLAGMDCSGYIWRVLQKAGYDVPYRDSSALRRWAVPISADEARPGDLVFWPGHAAIYAGGGRIYDSGSTSSGVTERNMWGGARFGRIPSNR